MTRDYRKVTGFGGQNAYNAPMLDAPLRKRLRAIAHHLDPVVIIGDSGVSAGVVEETNRALRDHELIKAKLHSEDRDDRRALGEALCAQTGAEVVQRIGKTLVLYRSNPDPNPKLSNLQRYK